MHCIVFSFMSCFENLFFPWLKETTHIVENFKSIVKEKKFTHNSTTQSWGVLESCFVSFNFSFFFLIHIYWSIIASQYYVSFCCTTKWVSHMHIYVPISPPSWASLPPSLSHPSRSSQSTELISLCYAAASH